MKLLLRPRWLPGESWTGYLLRIVTANELPFLTGRSAVPPLVYGDLIGGNPAKILPLIGFEHENIPNIEPPAAAEKAGRLPKGFRPTLTSVCPECLRAEKIPFFRARWEYLLEAECAAHKVRLVTSCPDCARPVSIRRGKLLSCTCGSSMLEWRVQPSACDTTELRRVLGVELPAEDRLTFQPISAREVDAFGMLRRIALEVAHDLGAVQKLRTIKPDERLRILSLAVPWFANWPTVLEHRLWDSSWRLHGCSTGKLNAKALRMSEFPQVASVIRRMAKARMSALRDEWLQGAGGTDASVVMSLTEVQRQLGIAQLASSRWARAGFFGPIERKVVGGVAHHFVRREAVQLFASLWMSTISVQEATERSGLSARAVCSLLAAGMLEARLKLRSWITARIKPMELQALSDRLLGCAVKTTSISGLQPISHALSRARYRPGGTAVPWLISFIESHKMPVYLPSGTEKTLRHAYVSGKHVRDLLRKKLNA